MTLLVIPTTRFTPGSFYRFNWENQRSEWSVVDLARNIVPSKRTVNAALIDTRGGRWWMLRISGP